MSFSKKFEKIMQKLEKDPYAIREFGLLESFSATEKKEICLKAVKGAGDALRDIPIRLLDKDICREALKRDGKMLELIPLGMLSSKEAIEMCMIAVNNNGYALTFVPEALRMKRICLSAITNNPRISGCVPDLLMHDLQFLKEAVSLNGEFLREIPEQKRSFALCSIAVRQCPSVIGCVPDEIRDKIEKDVKRSNDIKSVNDVIDAMEKNPEMFCRAFLDEHFWVAMMDANINDDKGTEILSLIPDIIEDEVDCILDMQGQIIEEDITPNENDSAEILRQKNIRKGIREIKELMEKSPSVFAEATTTPDFWAQMYILNSNTDAKNIRNYAIPNKLRREIKEIVNRQEDETSPLMKNR